MFVGGWIHSDDTSPGGEITFNLQTPSVFLDMRVPKAGAALLGHHKGFDTMTVRMCGVSNREKIVNGTSAPSVPCPLEAVPLQVRPCGRVRPSAASRRGCWVSQCYG